MDAATTLSVRPQSGPQTTFLSSPADIAIYGGGAGGGKTWGLLIEPLRHIHNPNFRAVIFRRTSPQISNPGGLWDESTQLYPLLGAADNRSLMTWNFPSGAVIRFAHMQHEKHMYDWQGSQIPLIEWDELTHFEQSQFFYMLSRNRSLSGVRPYMRAATNPDADSWVAQFIAWWINQETGFAIAERAGVLRWFVRVAEEIVWGDTRAELIEQYPQNAPKSVTFIPAKLTDNPVLMLNDPGYLANLLALPLVERERLLSGNWKVVPAGGKVFNRAWFDVVYLVPEGGVECRYWDFAATEKELKGDDPDFTAGVKLRKVGDTYYVMDCVAAQANSAAVDKLFLETTRKDLAAAKSVGIEYRVRWEIEPGSAGIRENRRMVSMLDGLDAKGETVRGDKLTRAKPFAVQAEHGFVALLKGEWNERWLTHMHHQPDWAHDDIMDASAGAYRELSITRKQPRSFQG